jgi:ABC-type nitrate/sulfonate/bicarbonate transport system ATPase subunit
MIVAENISCEIITDGVKSYIFSGISVTINKGSIVSIIGRSGSGKTSLLKTLAGLYAPVDGCIYMLPDRKKVKQPQTPIFMVFQDYELALLPWLTVENNIKLSKYKTNSFNNEEQLDEIVRELFQEHSQNIYDFKNKYPAELSGGQKQRVQIARAIFSKADFIFLDEPDSALDKLNKDAINAAIQFMASKNIGIVIATHDIINALKISDSIYLLNKQGLSRIDYSKELNIDDVVKDISDLMK